MSFQSNAVSRAELEEINRGTLFSGISNNVILKNCLQKAFQPIVTMAARTLSLKTCSLLLIDSAKDEFWICTSHAASAFYLRKPNIKISEGISGRVFKEKRTLEFFDVATEKDYRYKQLARVEGLKSLLSTPVQIGPQVIGVLHGYSGERRKFSAEEISTFEAVAGQIAMVIENELLREENAALRFRFKRAELVDQAKAILMEKKGLNEEEAYRLLRKTSMENQQPLAEIARNIIDGHTLTAS